jgi:hypothetical protein
VPSDPGLIRPAQDRVAGKFSPIVTYDHLGLAGCDVVPLDPEFFLLVQYGI